MRNSLAAIRWLPCLVAFVFAVSARADGKNFPPQLQFGFEPTATDYFIIWESFLKTLKKTLTGKGKGVLEIEGAYNTQARERYIEMIRNGCPECKITEVRESHGTISYQITYPDRFYIRASLDAGALEWQNKRAYVGEVESHLGVLQRDVFDLAAEAGVSVRLNALGGHTTFSGMGGDTFWYGNYLKLRTRNTILDWGFFGKDAYNATPVQLWDEELQRKYAEIHRAHDRKWERFLRKLEATINSGAGADGIMDVFDRRDLMSQKEYGEKLAEIYYNPKLESKLTGKRSKPKYVANRPGNGLIEIRAIRPQKNATQLLKMARFIEAEAWYVKNKIDQGYEVEFEIRPFTDPSPRKVDAQARKIVENLGLDWNDYKEFASGGDVELTGAESGLGVHFSEKDYGAAKRDALYLKTFEKFMAKTSLTERETVFLCELGAEMSYTTGKAVWVAKNLARKVEPWMVPLLGRSALERVMASLSELASKFDVARAYVVSTLDAHFESHAKLAIADPSIRGLSTTAKLLSFEGQRRLLDEIAAKQLGPAFDERLVAIHAELIALRADAGKDIGGDLGEFLSSIKGRAFTQVPTGFEKTALLAVSRDEFLLAQRADLAIVDSILENPNISITEADIPLFKYLAAKYPIKQDALYAPLRKKLAALIEKNGYGLRDYYHTVVMFEELNAMTPVHERANFLQDFLVGVRRMHRVKDDPDSESFIEKVEEEIAETEKRACAHYIGSKYFLKIKRALGL